MVLPSFWNEVVMSVALEPDSLELEPSLTPVHNPPSLTGPDGDSLFFPLRVVPNDIIQG